MSGDVSTTFPQSAEFDPADVGGIGVHQPAANRTGCMDASSRCPDSGVRFAI